MNSTSCVKKNKITLSDYDYESDLQHRRLLSSFTTFEMETLEEILCNSLKIPFSRLADDLDTTVDRVMPVIDKLSTTGLFKVDQDAIIVSKEMRKNFDFQISVFDEDFVPGMRYLKKLLAKLPIHHLPVWYSIPRTSDNILEAIVENFLETPKVYLNYLAELFEERPEIQLIAEEVFSSTDREVPITEICERHAFSPEQLEKLILEMELSFVCCLGHRREGDGWKQVLTPFHWWKEHLNFNRSTTPSPIEDETLISRTDGREHGFIEDMETLLKEASRSSIELDGPHATELIVRTLCNAQLISEADQPLKESESALQWLELPVNERAIYLYRHPSQFFESRSSTLWTTKNIRSAEKSLARCPTGQWFAFDDFIRGVTATIGDAGAVSLKKEGREWVYATPKYTEDERSLIYTTLMEYLFYLGMVETGTYTGENLGTSKACFSLTSFGAEVLGFCR